MNPKVVSVLVSLTMVGSLAGSAQSRLVAVTVDDLPYAAGESRALSPADATTAAAVNRTLVAALRQHQHDQVASFLARRGYRLAPCTIENSDCLFNRGYVRMLADHDSAAARLRADYLSYTSAAIDYYAALGRQVFGYEPPEIMLLHDNRLNADMINELLALFQQRHYRFVSLEDALADSAYRTPDTYVTSYGPMWGYRWAAARGVKVDGKLEPVPPDWILRNGR